MAIHPWGTGAAGWSSSLDLRGIVRGRTGILSVSLACVACTTAIGSGLHVLIVAMESAMQQELAYGGADVLYVETANRGSPDLGARTLRELDRAAGGLSRALVERSTGTLRADRRRHTVSIVGASRELERLQPIRVRAGRWWTGAEERHGARVVLLGRAVVDSVYRGTVPGSVQLGRGRYAVLGVVESGATATVELDRAILAPRGLLRRISSGRRQPPVLVVSGASPYGAGAEENEASFRDLWQRVRRTTPKVDDRVRVISAREQIGDVAELAGALHTAVAGLSVVLALASLTAVAALMSSIARTQAPAVGIMRALGAGRAVVVAQGVVIGVVIGGAGVALGVVLAAGLARIIAPLLELAPAGGAPLWSALARGAWLPLSVCVVVSTACFLRLSRQTPAALLA